MSEPPIPTESKESFPVSRRWFILPLGVALLCRSSVVCDVIAAKTVPAPRVPNRDDTAQLNARLSAAKAKGLAELDLGGAHVVIRRRLVIDSIALRNFSADLAGPSARIRLTGKAPAVHDYKIDHGRSGPASGQPEGGVFNLHLSEDAIIGKGTITGLSRRAAVSCVTRAQRTTIDGLVSHAAWGVFFNDQHSRMIDGVDYGDGPIGAGLVVRNCQFHGHEGSRLSGDGIEINVPKHGFADIAVEKCVVTRTISSASVGIAIGFANVRDAHISGCVVTHCTSTAGALHAEWSDNVVFEDCSVEDSVVGASISMSDNVTIRNCRFERSRVSAIQSYNQYPSSSKSKDKGRPTSLLVIQGCTFVGSGTGSMGRSGQELIAGRIDELRFIGNTIYVPSGSIRSRIAIREFVGQSIGKLVIADNHFVGAPNPFASLFSLVGKPKLVEASGNRFDNARLRDGFLATFAEGRRGQADSTGSVR